MRACGRRSSAAPHHPLTPSRARARLDGRRRRAFHHALDLRGDSLTSARSPFPSRITPYPPGCVAGRSRGVIGWLHPRRTSRSTTRCASASAASPRRATVTTATMAAPRCADPTNCPADPPCHAPTGARTSLSSSSSSGWCVGFCTYALLHLLMMVSVRPLGELCNY